MKPRIGVDARPLVHGQTGIGRYVASLLTELVSDEVDWYLYSDRKFQWRASVNVTKRTGELSKNSMSTVFAQYYFPRWAAEDEITLFWSPRHHLPLQLASPRKLLTIHDLVWKKVPETMARMGMLSERVLMPPSINMADAILAPSNATAKDLAMYFPRVEDKTTITPLAPLLNSVTSLKCKSTKIYTILMVGSLEPRKNYVRAIDAFLIAQKKAARKLELVIVGGQGWKNSEILSQIASARQFGVRYLGPLSDGDLALEYARAHMLFLPSLYEGFGLPIVEGFEFGLPAVVANLSSMPEVAGEAGVLVDPRNVESMASGLLQVVEDDTLYNRLVKAALDRAQLYSWSDTADRTQRVIDGLLA